MLFGVPMFDWVQLATGPGLKIRNPARAWASATTAIVLSYAGALANNLGGQVHVADVSSALKGQTFPPHVSHKWGYDADVGYTLDRYPTPLTTPTSEGFVIVLCVIAPWIEVVGVSETRRAQINELAVGLGMTPPKLAVWAGHATHAHLRFKRPQGVIVPGNTVDDDDGASNAQDYILPDPEEDRGSWDKALEEASGQSLEDFDEEDEDLEKLYQVVRSVIQEFLDSPEPLQKPDASTVLARRAYALQAAKNLDWPQTPWPDAVKACQVPNSPPCIFWNAALAYMTAHEV